MDTKEQGGVSSPGSPLYRYTSKVSWFGLDDTPCRILQAFWGCPIGAAREVCLDALLRKAVDMESARWIEERTPAMFAADYNDGYWARVLAWYLFDDRGEHNSPFRVRALQYATSLFLAGARVCNVTSVDTELSKIVAGAIRKYPTLYWVPSVPEFLDASLVHKNWSVTARALKLICLANDASFLGHVSELSRNAKKAAEKAEDFKTRNVDVRFTAAEALGVLQESTRHLLLCKTEEKSDVGDFCVELAQALRKHIGSEDVPRIRLDYFPPDPPRGYSIQLYLHVDLLGSVHDPLRDVLKKCNIGVSAYGCEIEISHPGRTCTDSELGGRYYYAGFLSPEEGFRLNIQQIRKTARLVISVLLDDGGMTRCIAGPLTYHIVRADEPLSVLSA